MAKIDLITVPLLDWPFAVLSVANDPPALPVLNDCYLIGAAPTGAWAGRNGQIARRNAAGAWEYQTPTKGRTVYDRSANIPRRFDGSAWAVYEATQADIAALQAADAAMAASITSANAAAANASSVAASAAATAATAQSAANSAVTTAATAQTAATTAQTAAAAAQTTANTAVSDAAVAQTTATNAGTAAASAASAAAAAQTTANTAVAAAGTAQTTATTAASTATTALSTANAAVAAIPPGGTTGQILAKASNTDRDTQWIPAPSGGGGGGDITDVNAGSGLTGGGGSGSVTLALDFGSGVNQTRRGNDAAYTDARAPTAHASSHADGGLDEINVSGLSGLLADPQRANVIAATGGNLNVGTIADGQMLVRSGATVVSAPIPTGDITSVTAGTGLSGGATSGDATLNVVYGTAANTAAQGNDARLSDDRTASGIRTATSVVSVSTAAAPSVGQSLVATSSTTAEWQTVSAGGGGDITAVIAGTGLSGGATTGDATLAVVYGASAGTAAEGNDARLSNARTPTSHAASHETGQPDAISPASIGAVPASRAVTAGTGLTGGGDLSADRSLAVSYGTTAGTSAQGDDSRLSDDRTASGLRTASGVVAISTATAPTAGQTLVAINGSSAAWQTPSGGSAPTHASQLRADTALSTTPTTLASVALPGAGTYNVTVSVRLVVSTGAPSTITGTFDHASIVELAGSWVRSKRNYTVDADRVYAKPTLFRSYSDAVGQLHVLDFRGHVIVSAGATIPVQVALSAGTGLALAGSYVTVTSESANVAPFGPTNFIGISSGGVGYAGTILAATSAGQWTADGVAIVGQTGTTYTVTRADEGKELRCGNSNPFQLWTPLHLPDVYKTDGTNFGGWWDPGDASSVTLNGSNVAAIANKFAGGPALQQANATLQVPYNAVGKYFDFPLSNQSAGYGLFTAAATRASYFATVCRYRAGTEEAFTSYSSLVATATSGSGAGPAQQGGLNTNAWYILANTGAYTDSCTSAVNCGEAKITVLPLPKSLVEATINTSAARFLGVGSRNVLNQNWQGIISETVVLAALLVSESRRQLQGYLMWHNAIQTLLPPDHEFYSAPPRIS